MNELKRGSGGFERVYVQLTVMKNLTEWMSQFTFDTAPSKAMQTAVFITWSLFEVLQEKALSHETKRDELHHPSLTNPQACVWRSDSPYLVG